MFLANGDSGARRTADIAAGLLANGFRVLSAYGARSPLYRNERKPISRESGTPHSLHAVYGLGQCELVFLLDA